MRRVITVHGMKRSGNHAIINWLRQQEKSCFFNDIIMIKPILLGQKEIPPSQPFTSWLSDNHYKKSPLSNLAKKIKSRNRSLYVSLEDHELSIRPFKDIPIEHINILIIRDATNHLASRLKSSLSNNYPIYPAEAGPQMDRVIATWKSHAREFLGETNQLNNKVCIYYAGESLFCESLFWASKPKQTAKT
ncbi:hypothetical protein [Candidatus Reidiella endopervernicosa]|uniref:Sulfotransferase family protein n=1 Tax=Candidatus Reidiella endopervernicosa TaxID=2738883 RepID=A0A6N0HYS6_9GAMM|nr:hypothetical protein [Candidatus Reidiella endopervernicosa]QKQ27530.1 hypothetical protein HUE57_15490 [Candidatus Reidiella endopervernicosa]